MSAFYADADYAALASFFGGFTITSASSNWLGLYDPGHWPTKPELEAEPTNEDPLIYARWWPAYGEVVPSLDPDSAPARDLSLFVRVSATPSPVGLPLAILKQVVEAATAAVLAGTPVGLDLVPQGHQIDYHEDDSDAFAAIDLIIPTVGVS